MNEQPDPTNTNPVQTTPPENPNPNPNQTIPPSPPPPVVQLQEQLGDSRLKEHVKKQTLRNVFLVLGGLAVLGILLFMFGTQMLIGLSLLLGKEAKETQEKPQETNTTTFVAPPVLDPLESATKSATIAVSGTTTSANETVYLYINGKLEDKMKSKKNKNFTFRNVSLKEGENDIKAKTVTQDNKQSNYSNSVKIIYSNKPPELTIESPQDGQTFKKDQSPIDIRGKTDAGVRVTVNEFWAIDQGEGKFLYNYTLKDGENKIKVVATDDAGNNAEKEITIKVE